MSTTHIDPLAPASGIGKAAAKVEDFFIKNDRAIMVYSGVSLMTTGASFVAFDALGLPSYLVLFVQAAFNISWVAAKLTGRK